MGAYFRAYAGLRPSHVELEGGATFASVAAACRSAGLAFVRSMRDGWSAADLAVWLTGPYRVATSAIPRGDCVRELGDVDDLGDGAASASTGAPRIGAVLASTRAEVLAGLLDAQSFESRLAFVRAAIRAGDVVPAKDAFGEPAWVPLDRRTMLLGERVLSLFATDFLARPRDYVADLCVCRICGDVVFDPSARALGHCGAHRSSGFMARSSTGRLLEDTIRHLSRAR